MYYNRHLILLNIALLVNLVQFSAIRITTPNPSYSNEIKTISNTTNKAPVGTGEGNDTEFHFRNMQLNAVTPPNGNSCAANQVCCPIPRNPNNPSNERSMSILPSTTPSTPICVCVPFNQCINHNPHGIKAKAVETRRKKFEAAAGQITFSVEYDHSYSSPLTIPGATPSLNCVCIPSYQCTDYDNSEDPQIDYKIYDRSPDCQNPNICCLLNKVKNISSPTSRPITVTPNPDCDCVPSHQCTNYDSLTDDFGAGKIDQRVSPDCQKPNVCCPRNKVNSTSSSTSKPIALTSNPNCDCVPSYQCTRYDNSGHPEVDFRFSDCQEPNICCPRDQVNSTSSSTSKPIALTSSPNCDCVPSHQCTRYDNSGHPEVDFRFSDCQEPNICCPRDQVINDEECGIRRQSDVVTRILSPEDQSQTLFGEFPWMALILTTKTAPDGTEVKDVFVCGASLLSPSVVLTAAHCVKNRTASMLTIRVGEYNTRKDVTEPLPYQERPVSYIKVHPEYHWSKAFNDLALLNVTNPFDLKPHISHICIPTTNTSYAAPNAYNPNQCMATGWGKNPFDEGSYQTILRKVDLSIVPRDRCQSLFRETRLGEHFVLHPSFICAGGKPGFDTCQGDGGGPLFCASRDNPKQYIQVGITSWGIGCATTTPGVYASLEANREWLTIEFNYIDIFKEFLGSS